METTLTGAQALQLAREISKIPEGYFSVAFYPYSRQRDDSSAKLTIKHGCKVRPVPPADKYELDLDNFFFFEDKDRECTCYRVLIRYMGFPHDNFKLHKIQWFNT